MKNDFNSIKVSFNEMYSSEHLTAVFEICELVASESFAKPEALIYRWYLPLPR